MSSAFTWRLGTKVIPWKELGLPRVLAPGCSGGWRILWEIFLTKSPLPTGATVMTSTRGHESYHFHSCLILQTFQTGRCRNVPSMNHHALLGLTTSAPIHDWKRKSKESTPKDSQTQASVSYWLVTKLPTGPHIFLREFPDVRAPGYPIMKVNRTLIRTTPEPPQQLYWPFPVCLEYSKIT